MKVVINKCYGGFSLSPLAIKYMAEIQDKSCFFFKKDYGKGVLSNDRYIPCTIDEAARDIMFSAFTIKHPDKLFDDEKSWNEMTLEERNKHNKLWESVSLSSRDFNRADPLLVKCIEELGNKANGICAKLAVIEIPDGTKYTIEEYDGFEHIAEEHRTWN
jgi:hypothetical protein